MQCKHTARHKEPAASVILARLSLLALLAYHITDKLTLGCPAFYKRQICTLPSTSRPPHLDAPTRFSYPLTHSTCSSTIPCTEGFPHTLKYRMPNPAAPEARANPAA
jgi:hypothetical protein